MSANREDAAGLFRYRLSDGYDQGGLLYFRFENREMVAVIRGRGDFEKQLESGTSLQDYVASPVYDQVFGAALGLEALIPEKSLPQAREKRQTSRP